MAGGDELRGARIRARRDPRRNITRSALIEKAEALIAEFGVDGVTARQIGAAIGSANNNVVAYHFGGKEELITAIYHHRLPAIEKRRAELLATLDARGRKDDLVGLLDALWRPLYEQRGEDGKHSYAAFLASIARSGWYWTRYSLGQDYQVVNRIAERIRMLVPSHARSGFHTRLTITAAMITNSLAALKQMAEGEKESGETFRDLLVMAAAALCADIDAA